VRLFVAAFPPVSVLSDLRRRVGHGAGRLTPVERWHITLRFLGEIAEGERADVERALDGVPRAGKISLRLAGGGQFSNGRSTVLWAGVQGDLDALTELHDAVGAALGAESEPFTPHLTVAYADSGDVRNALRGYTGPEWIVDEFVLVRSHHADGGGYQRLRAWPV
jgi:RNA 2',3'-cyclic 3'-phosphodiesterase